MLHLRVVALVLLGLMHVGLNRTEVFAQQKNMRLAFVLLSEARLPKGEDVVRSFSAFHTNGQGVQVAASKTQPNADSEILEFELKPKGSAFVMLLPTAVPNGEADDAVRFSVSAMGTGWKLPEHKAHLIVTCDCGGPAVESLSLLTSFLGAVVEASPAVGIYWGDASATHDPKFFLEAAWEAGIES